MNIVFKPAVFFAVVTAVFFFNVSAHAEEKSLQRYFHEAQTAQKRGDWARAEAAYTRAIELNRSYEALYYGRGEVRLRKSDPDGAISDMTQALVLIRKSPRAYHAYLLRAQAFFLKKDYVSSKADYEKVMAMDPASDEAYRGRGEVYLAGGLAEKALPDFTRAIELAPSSVNYAARGKAYFAQGEYKKSLEDYNRAVDSDPASDAAWAGRGTALFVLSDYRGALSDFNRAVALNPALKETLADFIEQAEKILKKA